jgi:hypothetical protein
MYQRKARPKALRWQMHSGGQPQRRPLGLWRRWGRFTLGVYVAPYAFGRGARPSHVACTGALSAGEPASAFGVGRGVIELIVMVES